MLSTFLIARENSGSGVSRRVIFSFFFSIILIKVDILWNKEFYSF